MKRAAVLIAFGLAAVTVGAPAMARDTLLKFDRGFGVDPVAGFTAVSVTVPTGTATVNSAVSNVVKNIPPAGRLWVIKSLKVTIEDGSILAKGEGLLLAATDGLGTIGANLKNVAVSLFCGTKEFDSGAVPINAAGDFVISGNLNTTPTSADCNPTTPPVLLIRGATVTPNAVTLGSWFAAGLLANED